VRWQGAISAALAVASLTVIPAVSQAGGERPVGAMTTPPAPLSHFAEASHAGWPQIDGLLLIDKGPPAASHVLRGTPDRHNELLGGYGNDTIYGGQMGDVIWSDFQPSGQPTAQVDTIYAGDGPNFIYTSHGLNIVHAGSGATTVLAHFGHGTIYCGSPQVVVHMSHTSSRVYQTIGCARAVA
jgi:hypothetical protein